jgi:excisionase family DNA binding protein
MKGAMKCANHPGDATENKLHHPLLTTHEAAAHLKLAPKTVRALCTSRRISAIRICRRWRIPSEEIERFKRVHFSEAV